MGGKSSKDDLTTLHEEDVQLLLKKTHFKRDEIISWHTGFIVSYYLSDAQ